MPLGKMYVTVPQGGFFRNCSAARNTGGNKKRPGRPNTGIFRPLSRREKKRKDVKK
jgi:hypothetical protein